MTDVLYDNAIALLKQLIKTPSFSGKEDQSATIIQNWLNEQGIVTERVQNNIWAKNQYFDPSKPSILLNSHHDTVQANKAYTLNPFEPKIENDKLYGLGSNDAGGSLVSLLTVFTYYYKQKGLSHNIIISATAEEENSGPNGISLLLKHLPRIDFAIVGEPTTMQMAIAEKGLMVIDAFVKGTVGHAAHSKTDDNAIYQAINDLEWIKSYEFSKISGLLGKIKKTVTQINAGTQHNVVPAECHFVIDVRVNELYSNKEVFEIMDKNTKSHLKARSFRLNSSSIDSEHPIIKAADIIGCKTFGSHTLSDQALMPFPSVKMGPGETTRSHSADEFIFLDEIKQGINIYINLLNKTLEL